MLHYVVSRLVYFVIFRQGDCIDFNESVAYSYALTKELGGDVYGWGRMSFFFLFLCLFVFL